MKRERIIIEGKWCKGTKYSEYSKCKYIRVFGYLDFSTEEYIVSDFIDKKTILCIVPAEQTYDNIDVWIDLFC